MLSEYTNKICYIDLNKGPKLFINENDFTEVTCQIR